MDEIKIEAPAKINLCLDILKKLDDGYHEIESIIQQVDLCDTIKIKKSDSLKINCNEKIPLKENLVYKTIKLLKENFDIDTDLEITVEKEIPLAAGLGGGSSDAAALLKGLNSILNLNLSGDKLIEIGSKIGMDVPFSIIGGTCCVKGKGEKVEKISSLGRITIVLINPGFELKTKQAYENLGLDDVGKKASSEKMLKLIKRGDIREIAGNLHNDFELSTIKKYPIIHEMKANLIKNGALNAVMSGSGPSVFGIFENEERAKVAYENLKDQYEHVFLTKTRIQNEG